MKSVAVFEAKNRFSELINAVSHGEEVTITRHGNPVARLIAFTAPGQAAVGQRERVQGINWGQIPINFPTRSTNRVDLKLLTAHPPAPARF